VKARNVVLVIITMIAVLAIVRIIAKDARAIYTHEPGSSSSR
jgi:hypothetical protein